MKITRQICCKNWLELKLLVNVNWPVVVEMVMGVGNG